MKFDYFERRLANFFYRYAYFVSGYILPFTVVPIVFSLICAAGFFIKKEVNSPEYLYTVRTAPSVYEQRVVVETFPNTYGRFVPGRSAHQEPQILAVSRNGSILEYPLLDEVKKLNYFIVHTLALFKNGRKYTYKDDLCMKTPDDSCWVNGQLALAELLMHTDLFDMKDSQKFKYPRTFHGHRGIYYGSTLGVVGTDKNPNPTSQNEVQPGYVKSAKAMLLLYQIRLDPEWIELSREWELEFERALINYVKGPVSKRLHITFFHTKTLEQGIIQNSASILGRFALSIGALVIFTVIFSTRLIPGTFYIDFVTSKQNVAVMGVVNSGLASLTSLGILGYAQFTFNGIVGLMPFLVLATGVDNMFIMQNAYIVTPRTMNHRLRLATALKEAGVSCCITSLTNALSFAVGCITDIPAVQIFCAYTALAVAFNYIYQMSFFIGVFTFYAKLEEQDRHHILLIKVYDAKKIDTYSFLEKLFLMGTVLSNEETKQLIASKKEKVDSADTIPVKDHNGTDSQVTKVDEVSNGETKLHEQPQLHQRKISTARKASIKMKQSVHTLPHPKAPISRRQRIFKDYYGPFLMHPLMKATVIVWLFFYLAIGIYGVTQVRQGLQPENLLLSDSYAVDYYRTAAKYFWAKGLEAQIVVNNVPDFNVPSNIKKFYEVMKSFTNTTYTMGMDSVQCWLLDFRRFIRNTNRKPIIDEYPQAFLHMFNNSYLDLIQVRQWKSDIIFKKWNICRLNYTDPETKKSTWFRFDPVLNETFDEPCNPDEVVIEKFRFFVGLRNFGDFENQKEAVALLRDIAASWPALNLTTFNYFWPFTDQYRVILPNTIQNIGIAIVCMVIVSLFLIPDPIISVWVVLAIVSIDIGIIGYMTLWGVNLDAISMITIIMSIGFSVDFSAHISYGYVSSKAKTSEDRVCDALESLGWPILLGGLSTIVGVISLSTVGGYLILTFFKTSFLVIVFGLIHSLVFLPVLLSLHC